MWPATFDKGLLQRQFLNCHYQCCAGMFFTRIEAANACLNLEGFFVQKWCCLVFALWEKEKLIE
jgi:hypothetical protein